MNDNDCFDLNRLHHFIKLTKVIDVSGKSRATIYAEIKKGKFPAPVRIGPRAVAWTAASIAEWQEQRIKASQAAA